MGKRTNDPLHVRDVFQQIKTIHRLVLIVQDDLGDLCAQESSLEPEHDSLVSSIEPQLQKLRDQLEKLSHVKP